MKKTFGTRVETRRARNRLNTRYPASVQTIAGSLSGMLFDLSLNGARFRLAEGCDNPSAMRAGRDVVLKWAKFEAFGTVVREVDGFYSIEFKPGIPPSVLLATRDLDDARALQAGSPPVEGPAA